MVLQPAIEGMLGLKPDAMKNTLGLALRFPFDWDSASAENIRLSDNSLSLRLLRTPETTTLTFHNTLASSAPRLNLFIAFPAGTAIESVDLDGQAIAYQRTDTGIELTMTAAGTNQIGIKHHGGISVLPMVYHPAPGDSSTGYKIISDGMTDGKYVVRVEGLSGSAGIIRIISSGKVTGRLFTFPASSEKYVQMDLEF
jgi:hypothetical protein